MVDPFFDRSPQILLEERAVVSVVICRRRAPSARPSDRGVERASRPTKPVRARYVNRRLARACPRCGLALRQAVTPANRGQELTWCLHALILSDVSTVAHLSQRLSRTADDMGGARRSRASMDGTDLGSFLTHSSSSRTAGISQPRSGSGQTRRRIGRRSTSLPTRCSSGHRASSWSV